MPSRYRPPFYKRARSTAASKIQAAIRRRKNRKPVKKGLTKVEKKQVKSIVSNRKEDKYCPNWKQYDDFEEYEGNLNPAISGVASLPGIFNAGSSAVTCVGLQMGNYLTTSATAVNTLIGTSFYPLGGIGMERGDTSLTIDGDYAYMKSCKLQLKISATIVGTQGSVDAQCLPLEFRVIQVRPKANTPTGTTPSLVSSLFVDNTNTAEGLGASGSVTEIMQNWRLNRNQFDVVKDFKFQLSNVQQPSSSNNTTNNLSETYPMITAYPNSKDIDLWLNRPKKKLRFGPVDNGVSSYYEPTNYQFQEYVVILCTRRFIDQQSPVFQPITKGYWQVRVNGMTKYNDA